MLRDGCEVKRQNENVAKRVSEAFVAVLWASCNARVCLVDDFLSRHKQRLSIIQ